MNVDRFLNFVINEEEDLEIDILKAIDDISEIAEHKDLIKKIVKDIIELKDYIRDFDEDVKIKIIDMNLDQDRKDVFIEVKAGVISDGITLLDVYKRLSFCSTGIDDHVNTINTTFKLDYN